MSTHEINRQTYYEGQFEAKREEEWNAAPGKDVLLRALKHAFRNGSLTSSERVADIGCGTGFLLNRIRNEVCTYWRLTGVDFSSVAIERGKALYDSITFLCEDGAATSLASEAFSVVVSYGSIEHFPSPMVGLAEVGRILRSGGVFFIMVPTLGHYRTDRSDEDWYADLTGQPQWNFSRATWESYFGRAGLSLLPDNCATAHGALKSGNFYFGRKR